MVTALRNLAASGARLLASYQRLADVYAEVLSEQRLEALLDLIADAITELVPNESLTILRADEASQTLVPALARGPWAKDAGFSFGSSISGWAEEHREAVRANDVAESTVCVPLLARGTLKGTLNVHRFGWDRPFDDEEFELARRFGEVAALALDNAEIRAQLQHQAHTDELTGLCNRRRFEEELAREFASAQRHRIPLALLAIDLDGFKAVNDGYGHGVGDALLRRVGATLRRRVRKGDTAARIGGDEFAVLLPHTPLERAELFANNLAEALGRSPLLVGTAAVYARASVGVAALEETETGEELLARADRLMYAAKLLRT